MLSSLNTQFQYTYVSLKKIFPDLLNFLVGQIVETPNSNLNLIIAPFFVATIVVQLSILLTLLWLNLSRNL